MAYSSPIQVFDFFSGCGGASKGFEQAGLKPVFAIDDNEHASKTFERNFQGTKTYKTIKFDIPLPKTVFLLMPIQEVPLDALEPIINKCSGHPILFAGCAPCQPFSRQKTKHPDQDPRKTLLEHFRHFVERYQPEYVFIENVPGIQKVRIEDQGPFDEFLKSLEKYKYSQEYHVVNAQNYGVPQKRRRLILIASRLGEMDFPKMSHGPGTENPKYSTPREWMDGFPPIKAGETDPMDPNHQSSHLSELNLRRIKATPPGGDRLAWPKELWLSCHNKEYTGHTDVYGRVEWDKLANCLTTKCTSLTNGRYGHPDQDRSISPREAACLQTFPRDFFFDGGITTAGRQIGNAVPVLLAQKFGEHFNNHIKEFIEGGRNVEI